MFWKVTCSRFFITKNDSGGNLEATISSDFADPFSVSLAACKKLPPIATRAERPSLASHWAVPISQAPPNSPVTSHICKTPPMDVHGLCHPRPCRASGAGRRESEQGGGQWWQCQLFARDIVQLAEKLPPSVPADITGFHRAGRGRRGELISAFLLSVTPGWSGGESGGGDAAALAFSGAETRGGECAGHCGCASCFVSCSSTRLGGPH